MEEKFYKKVALLNTAIMPRDENNLPRWPAEEELTTALLATLVTLLSSIKKMLTFFTVLSIIALVFGVIFAISTL